MYQSRSQKSIKFLKKYNSNNITNFIKDYLLNTKIILTVSYDKSKTKEVIKLIKKYFDKKIKKNKSKIKKTKLEFKNNKLKVVYLKNTSLPNTHQIEINCKVFYKIIKYSKRFFCLRYLFDLFNDFSTESIFYNTLRTKLGFIYSISFRIYINNTNPNYSNIEISTNCSKKNLTKLINEILNIFDNLLSKSFTKNTLNILYKNKIRNLSTVDKNSVDFFSDMYSSDLLFNKKVKDFQKIINIYKGIKLKDFRKEFEILKYNFLNKGIIFYNGNKNLNKEIEKINKKKLKIN